jgi:hypothetical protein
MIGVWVWEISTENTKVTILFYESACNVTMDMEKKPVV